MCGVIGYVGRRDAAARLLSGLERLEYRGYDSAGICLLSGGRLELIKAVGKLENLKRKAGQTGGSTTGIGHTRWATHGRAPRRMRIRCSRAITTMSRSSSTGLAEGEVRPRPTPRWSHLVRRAYRGSLVEAVRTAYGQLEGHFAFVVAPSVRA